MLPDILEKPLAGHERWPAFLVSCAYILENSERMNTMKVLTARGMRLLEAAAVEEGLDYRRLMENAGSAAARRIRTLDSLSAAPPLFSVAAATMAATALSWPVSWRRKASR